MAAEAVEDEIPGADAIDTIKEALAGATARLRDEQENWRAVTTATG